jgi:hypothetical protein
MYLTQPPVTTIAMISNSGDSSGYYGYTAHIICNHNGVTFGDIASALGRQSSCISQRFCGKLLVSQIPFDLDDVSPLIQPRLFSLIWNWLSLVYWWYKKPPAFLKRTCFRELFSEFIIGLSRIVIKMVMNVSNVIFKVSQQKAGKGSRLMPGNLADVLNWDVMWWIIYPGQ